MEAYTLSPDSIIYWQSPRWELLRINATLVYTWLVMALLTVGSWLVTRRLSTGTELSRWQNLLEVVVTGIRNQIRDVMRQEPGPYLPFIGTLFLYISISGLLTLVPGYRAATESLSTTAALAVCVFFAVPIYGVLQRGVLGYLKSYIEPSPVMLPFQIIGELSRTLALAIRLFGNMMSGALLVGILFSLAPLVLPIAIQLLGLLTSQVQAYIFAVLAAVYIAAATRAHRPAPHAQAEG